MIKDTMFLTALCEEALNSSAVNHPYLDALREGDLPNIGLAFQDFAYQYGFYSERFVEYLSAVIRNLSNPEHKEILLSNLAEEEGDVHDLDLPPDVLASVVGQPHSQLYRRFQQAVGVDTDYRQKSSPCEAVLAWRQQFLQLCEQSDCVGIGAIGIGTELIVSRIYDQILEGLKRHSQLTMKERVFFELHNECDDEHAAQMLVVTEDLASSPSAEESVESGVRKAIELRTRFWDSMLERAHRFPEAAASGVENQGSRVV